MISHKIGLIDSRVSPEWASCRTIMPNLAKAYDLSTPLQRFYYDINSKPYDILKTAKQIKLARVQKLIFIDHMKHPMDLLEAMSIVMTEEEFPELIFHLYGDFTIFTPEWERLEPLLKNKKVRFVCASERQRNMIRAFLGESEACADYCHFPVRSDEFSFDPKLRKSSREIVFCYTGRLSLQKNILAMLEKIPALCKAENIPFRFILAGNFDDLGSPFFGVEPARGDYETAVQEQIQILEKEFPGKVVHVGNLDKEALLKLYHEADVYVSFSTHHDEDYGMAPAEAMSCGLKAVLTDWGGFSSFRLNENCILLPTTLTPSGPQISVQGLGSQIRGWIEANDDRVDRAQTFQESFGVEAAAKRVKGFLLSEATRFQGFAPLLNQHSKEMGIVGRPRPLFAGEGKTWGLYRQSYSAYGSLSV